MIVNQSGGNMPRTDKPIRVGFIGLNPGIHWAATAHIRALQALPDQYEVVGVANPAFASADSVEASGHRRGEPS
ncbi:hypothetical protein SH591_00615 [Sphingomonas sp. LY54]|uniref:hypothetical protein n=1 Tax=Sphingomonas sp. LY54 TaxID=3095343 RepID=UPI002D788E03|nr:hypothetical protein [Sphingomonas sp. LY54]WRP28726.1 hypothetical protein SH591_00615 [Sphingomonas sp. LY54]